MPTTQKNRRLRIETDLGADALLLERIKGEEGISLLFEYHLNLASERSDLRLQDLVGRGVTVTFTGPRAERVVHGHVAQFLELGYSQGFHRYAAVLRPWLWFLSHARDSRIFQEMTVPEIVKDVFSAHGFTDFLDRLSGSYEKREFCVQYEESDLNFVTRLLEEEGIYYYFVHRPGRHELVLADGPSAHEPVGGYERVAFRPDEGAPGRREEHVLAWTSVQQVVPGRFSHTSYDFTRPRTQLRSESEDPREHAFGGFEVYHWSGRFDDLGSGDRRAGVRLEALQQSAAVCSGRTDAVGLACGARFDLTEHPRADANGTYVLRTVTVAIENPLGENVSGRTDEVHYSCAFDCSPVDTHIRPAQTALRPVVHGPQTAFVTGPATDDIHTDKHGRVKVRFHWDRSGRTDDTSSCWIRVGQIWAGQNWGGVHIPRVGHEVIVSFLDGDPDRPIVTGAVYNGLAAPPYGLPAEKTRSGIRSRTTKDGGAANFNELMFEDKKGDELVYLQAEKDYSELVKNDAGWEIGNDLTSSVGNDVTSEVGNDQKETIGETLTIDVGRQITLKTGAASLVMKQNGDILVKGTNITIKGSMNITQEAGVGFKAKGGVTANVESVMTTLKASGIATIKGALTKIN